MAELKKKCSKCEKWKTLEEFYNKKRGKYGKDGVCIECKKKYNKIHSKKWYQEHREKKRKYYVEVVVDRKNINFTNRQNGIISSKINYTDSLYIESYFFNNPENKCIDCGEWKTWNKFSKSNQMASGYKNICKKCQNKRVKQTMLKPPLYKTYKKKLEKYEDIKEGPNGELLIKCALVGCDIYFVPRKQDVKARLQVINGTAASENSECKIYCCNEHKAECPTHWQHSYTKNDKPNNYLKREYPNEFREMVFEKYGRKCAICGSIHDVEAHHINPAKISPMTVADVDEGIPLCHRCHLYVHTLPGCSFAELRNTTCSFDSAYEYQRKHINKIIKEWKKIIKNNKE